MKTILLVEDDAMIASGLVYAFEQEGGDRLSRYVVTHAGSVREARDAIANGSFDLAILDMQLPDGTGFDVREMVCINGREIRKLSADIRRIIDGQMVDLRDNREDAFSILKNDIHTLANLKNEQVDALQADRDI
jgi:CheY-like chemotaxis protein